MLARWVAVAGRAVVANLEQRVCASASSASASESAPAAPSSDPASALVPSSSPSRPSGAPCPLPSLPRLAWLFYCAVVALALPVILLPGVAAVATGAVHSALNRAPASALSPSASDPTAAPAPAPVPSSVSTVMSAGLFTCAVLGYALALVLDDADIGFVVRFAPILFGGGILAVEIARWVAAAGRAVVALLNNVSVPLRRQPLLHHRPQPQP